jgi:hypothetical protein
MALMDRHNNLRAFERGARAMLDNGIMVKVDLILGLPGDTVDSIRRGIDYIHSTGLYSEVQVFNLAVLPGTAFRQDADQHGLVYQDRPPYYVLGTPTLGLEQMYELMEEAQDVFDTEFDPLPPPVIPEVGHAVRAKAQRKLPARPACAACRTQAIVNLESGPIELPQASERVLAFTLWLRSASFDSQRTEAADLIAQLLADNQFTTLQIILEPLGEPSRLTARTLEALRQACYRQPTYLDKFYSVLPGRPKGAKRLVVLLDHDQRSQLDAGWLAQVDLYATVVYRDAVSSSTEAHWQTVS